MEKKAKITIRSTQKAPHEPPQTLEFVTEGMLRRYGRKLRVSYEESDMIGTAGVTTAFEIDGDRVALERSGKIQSRMEFSVGKKTESLYSMDMGTLLLGVTARRVEPKMSDGGGSIYLEYGIEVEQSFIGLNSYDIRVETEQ